MVLPPLDLKIYERKVLENPRFRSLGPGMSDKLTNLIGGHLFCLLIKRIRTQPVFTTSVLASSQALASDVICKLCDSREEQTREKHAANVVDISN